MEFKLIKNDGHVTLQMHGRFDSSVSFDFFAIATKAMHQNPAGDIHVDLVGVDYIDSSSIGKLVHFNRELGETGRRLKVINARPDVRKVLMMMGMPKLFTVVSDQAFSILPMIFLSCPS